MEEDCHEDDAVPVLGASSSRRESNPPPVSSQLSPILFGELVIDILSRLPAKSLVKFKGVSKPWKSLISEIHFVKKQLRQSNINLNFNHHRLLLASSKINCESAESCSVKSLFDNSDIVAEDLSYPAIGKKYSIVGTCNGLICLADTTCKSMHIRFWNPTTRLVSKQSPFLDDHWEAENSCFVKFGFGYDNLIENFKVVAVFTDPAFEDDSDKTQVRIFTLGSNSWRVIQNFSFVPLLNDESGTHLNGTLNWLATNETDDDFPLGFVPYDKWVIVSFDLEKETYSKVLLPDGGVEIPDLEADYSADAVLGVLKDSLCFSYVEFGETFVLWVMNEFGVKESWTKVVTISYAHFELYDIFHYPKPLLYSKNDGLLLETGDGMLAVYDPKDKTLEFPRIGSEEKWSSSMVYVESLVSPS